MSQSTRGRDGREESFFTAAVQFVGALAHALDASFDQELAEEALEQAFRDIPGSFEETWAARIIQTGKNLELPIIECEWSLGQAIESARAATPVGVLVPDADGAIRWLLLLDHRGDSALVAGQNDQPTWMSQEQLLELFRWRNEWDLHGWVQVMPAPTVTAGEARHHHHSETSPLTRLVSLLRLERHDLWLILAFTLGIGVLSLAVPLAVEIQFQYVEYATLLQPVILLAIVLLVFLGLDAAVRAVRVYVVEILQRRILVRMVAELAYRLPRVRCEVYEDAEGPEVGNRFFDIFSLQKASATLLIDGLTLAVQTAVTMIVLALYHPFLLGFDVVLVFVVGFLLFNLGRGAVGGVIDQSIAKYEMASWLEEMTRQPLAFKLSGGPRYALTRADALTRDYLLNRQEFYRVLFRQILFALGLQAVAGALLLGLGSWLVINGQLTKPQLLASELLVAVLIGSFAKLGKSLESYYDLMASMDKLGLLIDLPLERDTGERHVSHTGPAALKLHNVSFSYENSSRLVLLNQNWSVAPGERIALCGPDSSGKSTLVQLLLGLREPVQGHIELDGVDLRDISLESLRHQVCTVMGYEIFKASLVDNVRVGRVKIGLAEVREALKRVGLLDAALALPQGLRTPLSANGAPLSNKQARQLMLARAVVAQPRLLVLDEFLDQMDRGLRERVMDALFDRSAPWTLIVTTFSNDVIQRCDRVIALDQGSPGGAASASAPPVPNED